MSSIKFVDGHSVIASFTVTGAAVGISYALSYLPGCSDEEVCDHELVISGRSREAIREALRALSTVVSDSISAIDGMEP